jgi:glucose uptake protein
MFTVSSLPVAIVFCIVTMLGWGSWANTQKLAGNERWPFPLFYWDYAIGVCAFGIAFALTLGSMGELGEPALANLKRAGMEAVITAALSGVLFNLSNILLVVAIDRAGMSVAFPIGVGLALSIGTIRSYLATPQGNPYLLFTGVTLIVLAMIFAALAYRRLPRRTASGGWISGVGFAIAAGCLMGSFYPQLMRAISPDFNSGTIRPGMMTPYSALLLFGVWVLASNLLFNTVFMRASGATYAAYFRGNMRLHTLGFLGGVIWMVALCLNVIASGVAGPAISYALGQGATLVAAIWGVFIWREFRGWPAGTKPLVGLMFAGYALGLVLIGLATLK